jgi:copper resistance protein D
LLDPLIDARILHFAATLLVAGVVFFLFFVAAPAWRHDPDVRVAVAVRAQLAWLAWFGLGLALASGAAWLVATAAGMSGSAPGEVFTDRVLWTVLTQTTFGNTWLVRIIIACALGALLVPLFSARPSKLLDAAVMTLAAAFVGSLAWSGHAAGGLGVAGFVHPAADILHLIAAAAWVGALLPLVLLFAAVAKDDGAIAIARTATTRFSSLGIASVGTLLVTGILNTWYLVGTIDALTGTKYGELLLVKIALFLAMVAIAAANNVYLTPRLLQKVDTAKSRDALRHLQGHASLELLGGAAIIVIVGVLGTLAPASHAHHEHVTGEHMTYGALPADAAFVHIHAQDGMAEVMIEPGRVGTARATIHLWTEDSEPLDAREVTLTLTAPSPGAKPVSRTAVRGDDGAWQIDDIELPQSGNWTARVDALLGAQKRLDIAAPIVIDP